ATPVAVSSPGNSLIWYKDANYTDTIIKSSSFETAALTSNTVFYVESISVDGCVSRNSVQVTVLPLQNSQVQDTSVCYGTQVILNTFPNSDTVQFEWYIDQNNSGLTIIELTSDTVFYVETISVDGCISIGSIHIFVNPLPDLTVKDTAVCAGIMTLFTVSSQDAVSLTWFSDTDYLDAVNHTSSYETALDVDTVFYIEALSDKGCSIKKEMNISVAKYPVVVAMDDVYLCYGDEITLSTLESEGTLNWNVDPITFRPLHSQDYIVTASQQFCPDVSDTVMVTVSDSLYIYPTELPAYKVYTDYNQQIYSNAQSSVFTLFNGNLPLGLTLSLFGNLSGTPYVSNDNSISVFTVQVEDAHNCVATHEYMLEEELYIPKIFTPNNDGINDYFMKGYEIIIFDRFGIEVFKGDNGWDGTYKNKIVPHDIYYYKLIHKNKTLVGYVGVE
ncbi:MAG: T9SS type B sorting domain-containing protein, partial [Prevotellaceae bacterium]|nr:T9SS type B sorting domain-containing protein [Prevotellaceae bacterium]